VKGAIANGLRRFYEFGEFRLDTNRHRLLRAGELIPLSPKAIETLTVLLQNPGKLIEREDLMHALWPDTIVEDANLTVAISQLRKALNQNGDAAEFIQTIPRVGYRFVADVKTAEERSTPLRPAPDDAPETNIELDYGNGGFSASHPAAAGPEQIRWARVVVAVASIVVLALTGLLLYSARGPKLPGTSGQVKTMAVLPFKILSADAGDEYMGTGLADALITQIGRIRQILVRPTGAVQKYAESHTQDPLVAGRELRVEAVLDGTVQREADNLRVTVRLLRVGDGAVLWSGKFDEKFRDVFAVQDSISQEVARALISNLSGEDRKLLTKRHTDNVEAYRLYLKGRYFWNKRTPAGLNQSLGFFRQALDLDPTYSSAYAGMADAYALLVWQEQLPRDEFIARAKAAATKALEIDQTLAEPHATLGYVKFWYDWDFAAAESEFRRAIELSPDYATAHHWYGESLGMMGRFDDGLKELRLAQQVDPLSAIINADLGKLLFLARQPDQAIEQLRQTLELNPDLPLAHVFLGLACNKKGLHEQAIAELERVANGPGSRAIFKATLGFIYGQSGREAEARSILGALIGSRSSEHYVSPFHIALVYVGLGEKDNALEWLEKAKTEHDPFLIYIKTDPNFDSLRSDPRFPAFLRRIGLE
jgi:DNA-binding winged helix-turn-helix (wHTH) protein/TolB-like protein/Flp pilus assembly protein TadD